MDNKKQNRKEYIMEYRARPEVIKREKEYGKMYRRINKEKIRLWKLKNKEKRKEYDKQYYQKYKQRINMNKEQRIKKNKSLSVKEKIRGRFKHAINNYSKTGKIMPIKDYGIDMNAIIKHLQPFPQNMENYHIDHIVPLCMFNHNNPEQIKRAWAPQNLQWLTVQQNLEKGNRLVMPHYNNQRGLR